MVTIIDNIPGLVSTEQYEIPFNRQLDRLPVPVSSEPRQAYSTGSLYIGCTL